VPTWLISDAFLQANIEDKGRAKSIYKALIDVATLNSKVLLTKGADEPEEAPLKPTGDATELGLYRYM